MEFEGYIEETIEEIELELNGDSSEDDSTEDSEDEDSGSFGSFEIDPDAEDEVYIPGTDEKIN